MEELSLQQKLWKGMGVVWYSLKPLFLYLCIPAFLTCLGMILFRGRDVQDMIVRSSNFYQALGMLLTLALLYRRSKKQGSSLWQEATLEYQGLSRKRMALLFGMGFGIAVLFSSLLTIIPFPNGLSEAYQSSSSRFLTGTDQVVALVSAVMLAPVAEEIIFRGYMLGRLLGWFNSKQSILISSVVFALCHVSFLWMIYACLLGVILGWVSLREDNTMYSIALHVGFNASVLPIHWVNNDARLKALLFGTNFRIAFWGISAGLLALWAYRSYRREEMA